MMIRLLLVFLLSTPLLVSAQIYKSVDENGNTVYSDRPPADGPAEKIQLGTPNSTPPPPRVARPEPAVEQEAEKEQFSVNIMSPAPETTIAIGYAGNFTVEAEVTPTMAHGTFAQLLMDGVAIGGPQPHVGWVLSNVYRGSHSLAVVITDGDGEQLAESPPITVHVLRAGLGH